MKAHAKTCSEQLEEIWGNFKVELRWLPMTELAQIFFMAPCLSTLHSIFSGHVLLVQVPFHYEGTWGKNETGHGQKAVALCPNTTYIKCG